MKRDMDLIRKILFYIEKNYVAGGNYISVEIDGYTEGEIYEHCMLAYWGGFIAEPLPSGCCPLTARSWSLFGVCL